MSLPRDPIRRPDLPPTASFFQPALVGGVEQVVGLALPALGDGEDVAVPLLAAEVLALGHAVHPHRADVTAAVVDVVLEAGGCQQRRKSSKCNFSAS